MLAAGVDLKVVQETLGHVSSTFTRDTFTGPTGTFRQVTDLTKSQIDLLSKLRIDHPKKIIDLQTAPR